MSAKKLPVRVAPIGEVALATKLWRLSGQTMMTVAAKVTARMVQNGVAQLVSPEPVFASEQNDLVHPRSVVRAAELAPMLQKADVTMTGTAWPPPHSDRLTVRLSLTRGHDAVLDKSILVMGKRKGGATPAPFDKMWLGWENAWGGLGFEGNPLGTGKDEGSSLPNLVSPTHPQEEAACFAPVSAIFPSRRKRSRLRPRELKAEIMDVPVEFDWAYFQSAPTDQQIARLYGDEWLRVEGVHPTETLCTQLPGIRIATHVYGHSEAGVPDNLPLRYDMLHIDLDSQCVMLVARGSFPIQHIERCAQMVVAATPRAPNEGPYAWPERPPGPRPLPARRQAAARQAPLHETMDLSAESPLVEVMPDFQATMDLRPSEAPKGSATPFAGGIRAPLAEAEKAVAIELPGAPWASSDGAQVPVDFAEHTVSAPVASPAAQLTDEEMEAIFAKERQARENKRAEDEAKAKAAQEAEAKKQAAAQEAEKRRKAQALAFEEEQRLAKEAKEAAQAKKKSTPNLRGALYKKRRR